MKNQDPASKIQDLLQFGEFGDVNPSITDSATYTFMEAKTMLDTFKGEKEGCFLYSRHWTPRTSTWQRQCQLWREQKVHG